ncbi:NAD binding domain of 6-phosphogluconate dehydrogenase-domain-containing protein [Dactylonectria macrodidyma]|uniref:NAD binding domain of 6-phosphogluconate dehydrogenase-domain-containing protein n=1 Tax=Dactylonectria macrodidyma TaxID=307937 RepID=A0A9P9EBS9_9HYPO|nr:NAD binding domain of 6-phosphogluconate dehydrogenase-domain-containing protein [Dactylonectria macrodidyma]
MPSNNSALPRVSICGLGAMGIGMSQNLIKDGFSVSGYDVVPQLVDRFVQSGGQATLNPKEAAQNADVLLVIVVNHAQVTSVLFQEGTGAVYGLAKNAAIIISSTVPGAFVQEVRRRLDSEFGRPDVLLLDCPVSGGASGAADGTLTVFACGTDEGFSLAEPVLQSFGSKICRIKKTDSSNGGTGSGANGKVCHQVIPEIAIALVAEIMALATRAGLNTQMVYDHLQSGIGASWIMKNRIPHALEGDETVYSAMTNSQKDSSIIVRTAGEKSVPVPLVATAEQIYQTTVYIGWAGMDDSATWRLYLRGQPNDAVYRQTKIATDVETLISLQDIEDIMVGVHLAATAEARAFTDAVGLNAEQMFEIVCSAAGWNVQYEKYALKMRKGPWYLREIEESKDIGVRLSKAVTKASSVGANLPIAAAAVQVFEMQVGPLFV